MTDINDQSDAVADKESPNLVSRRVPVTPEQVSLLQSTEQATQASIQRMSALLAAILAGQGIKNGTFVALDLGPPPVIVCTVTD